MVCVALLLVAAAGAVSLWRVEGFLIFVREKGGEARSRSSSRLATASFRREPS